MIFAVYEIVSGRVAFLTEDPSTYTGTPLTCVAIPHAAWPDPLAERWNPTTRAFEPIPRRGLTHLEFLDRFTADEYYAINQARTISRELDFNWQKLFAAQPIDLDDPRTVDGVTALEQSGLLAEGRTALILA